MARAARTAAARPSTPCPRSSKPCAAASRCWSTADSGAAPTSSRAWPSVRARYASAGPTSGAWAPSASPASSACSSSCASSCRRRCSNAARARSGSSRRRSCAGRPERGALLLRGRSDRLAFLDDVGGEHPRRAAADVLAIVHLAGFDEERIARLQRPGRLAVDFEHQRSLDDVAELLAGMRVLARRTTGDEFRQRLHGVALRHAQVLVLQVLTIPPLVKEGHHTLLDCRLFSGRRNAPCYRFASSSRRRLLRHGAPGFVVWNERDVLRREPAGATGPSAHSRRAGLHQAGRAGSRESSLQVKDYRASGSGRSCSL